MDSKLEQLLHTDGPWSDAYAEGFDAGQAQATARIATWLEEAATYECTRIRHNGGIKYTRCTDLAGAPRCFVCGAKELLGGK